MRSAHLLVSAIILCTSLDAQRSLTNRDLPADTEAKAAAQAFRRFQTKGRQTRAQIKHVVHDLVWHRKLDRAQAAAKEQNRPILWIQMLGDLTGYT